MSRDDEILQYNMLIGEQVQTLKALMDYEYTDPRDVDIDVSEELYDVAYTLNDAVEKLDNLITMCKAEAQD